MTSTSRAGVVTRSSCVFDFNALKTNAIILMKEVTNKLSFTSLKGDFNFLPSQVLNIIPPSELSKQIQVLSNGLEDKKSNIFKEEQQKLCIDAIKSNEFPALKTNLSKIIGKLDKEQLNDLLIALFKCCPTDPLPVINKLKSLLTLQKIDALVGYSSLTEAQRMSDFVAREYQTVSDEKKQTYLRTAAVFVENIVDWVIENFKLAFALNDIGGEVDDPSQATMRVMMFFNLWGSVNAWLISLSAMLGSVVLTVTVVSTGLFIFTAALVVYNKWLKPAPEHVSPFINLTSEAAKGNISKGVVQEGVIKQIVQTLSSNSDSSRRFPILIGPPGSGKSVIMRDMAAMMNAGKIPELKNVKFFLGVGTDLDPETVNKVNKNRSVDNLTKFCNVMNGKNVLLGIDEFHALGTKGPAGFENLKTRLDVGPKSLRYFIGATTPREYEKYIAGNYALERRFELIPVGKTKRQATTLILKVMARHEAEDIDIDDDVFNTVYTLCKKDFPDLAQPAKAKNILSKAFSRVRSFRQNSVYAETVRELRNQRSVLSNDYMRLKETKTHTPEIDQLHKKLIALNTQIDHADAMLKDQMDKYESFAKLKIQRNELKRDLHMMSIKIANNSADESYIKEFAFKQNFLMPALDELINKIKMPEGSTKVDSKLIEDIIREEVENKEKSKKKTDPEVQEAYIKTKNSIKAMSVKIAKNLATPEDIEKLKTDKDYVLPALEEALKN